MTKSTYNKILKMNKGYLIEFIRSIEELPQVRYLGGDDLSEKEIKKYDEFYSRWFNN